jgi:hypothetical protein
VSEGNEAQELNVLVVAKQKHLHEQKKKKKEKKNLRRHVPFFLLSRRNYLENWHFSEENGPKLCFPHFVILRSYLLQEKNQD